MKQASLAAPTYPATDTARLRLQLPTPQPAMLVPHPNPWSGPPTSSASCTSSRSDRCSRSFSGGLLHK